MVEIFNNSRQDGTYKTLPRITLETGDPNWLTARRELKFDTFENFPRQAGPNNPLSSKNTSYFEKKAIQTG